MMHVTDWFPTLMNLVDHEEGIPTDRVLDGVDHAVGEVVLEHLGLLVDDRPVEAEHAHEEGLEEAVAAEQVHRDDPPLLAEPDPAARRVVDVAVLRQPLDHRGDRRLADPEMARQLGRRDPSPLALLRKLEPVDRLEVVLPRGPLQACLVRHG